MMHYSGDFVELYLLGHLGDEESATFEEHYIACPTCLNQLEETQAFIADVRSAFLIMQSHAGARVRQRSGHTGAIQPRRLNQSFGLS